MYNHNVCLNRIYSCLIKLIEYKLFHSEVYTEVMGACEKPSVLVTSPGSPDVHSRRRPRHNHHNANVAGRIQVCSNTMYSRLQIK